MTTSATTTNSKCPVCHDPLVDDTHESAELLSCRVGHGVFVAPEALQLAVRDRTKDRPVDAELAAEAAQGPIAIESLEQRESERNCPVCELPMSRRVYAYESGVAIDVCDVDGIWLDAGELPRIEAWYEAQERHREADTATWGGAAGRLDQIELDAERQRAEDVRSVHWGPIGRLVGGISWKLDRRDDK